MEPGTASCMSINERKCYLYVLKLLTVTTAENVEKSPSTIILHPDIERYVLQNIV